MKSVRQLVLCAAVCSTLPRGAAAAGQLPAHGLWVWKSASVLEAPRAAERLRDFCRSADINEVYVSLPAHGEPSIEPRLVHVVALLHQSRIRVEALVSSNDADEVGPPRDKLLGHIRHIVQFNRDHAATRFDGIHLDIEPQQRLENKGASNLRFVPGLVDAYRAVLIEAGTVHLPVNADIQIKLLKGNLDERRLLLSSLPRLTLMLYELSKPGDGDSAEQWAEKLRVSTQKILDQAYDGLSDPNLALLTIALRTPDYGELLPQMLKTLDQANSQNPHYGGWARHSYSDYLLGTQGSGN